MLVLIGIALVVTWLLDADVNAQGGAYATGVLVLITSAAVAVTLSARRAGQRRLTVVFAVIALIFVYTTIDNILERPDGVKIGGFFIAAIVAVSIWSRLARAFAARDARAARRNSRDVPARLRAPEHPTGGQRTRRPGPRGVR